MDGGTAKVVLDVSMNPNMDFSNMPSLYFRLRMGGFLVEDMGDDNSFNSIKMRRLVSNYSDEILSLTIAPTKACNFACKYCYELDRVKSDMSDEVIVKIKQFIEKHSLVRKLEITWYGGEPLLELEKIRVINRGIAETGKKYDSFIITNGFCLNKKTRDLLDELKVSRIQITLDGTRETHDKRRHLLEGGGTYDTIVSNIDGLMKSSWSGRLLIRVNIDKQIKTEFLDVYKFIEDRYPEKFNKQIEVYPGFLYDYDNQKNDLFLDSKEKGSFVVAAAREHGVIALPVFPRNYPIGGCLATKKNSYMIGPDGELYKCWVDLGNIKESVGSIVPNATWNTSLIAESVVGASYLDDAECIKCAFFPLCDGGCPKVRMQNNRDMGSRDVCSYFKEYAKELLEIHYEQRVLQKPISS